MRSAPEEFVSEEFIVPPTLEEREAKIAQVLIFRFGMSEEEAAAVIDNFNATGQTPEEPEPPAAA